MRGKYLFPAIFVLLFTLVSYAFEGKVVGVTDGDTIKVLHNGNEEKIRLNGIDCPESGQAFGHTAKLFVSDMVFGKIVTVTDHGQEKYGRTIGDVTIDGKSLNKELITAGLAWWYRHYSKDKELEELEKEAKLERKGDLLPIN